MPEIAASTLIIAFAVTLAAGLATVVGSFLVLASKKPSPRLLAFGLAFAGGAMVYVSLSEILNKSIAAFNSVYHERLGFTYGTLAFLAGVFAIVLLDHVIPIRIRHWKPAILSISSTIRLISSGLACSPQ